MAEKKTAAKKTAAKKPVEAAVKTTKTTAKKTTTKKAVKPVVEKKTQQDYMDLINWKKGEAHGMDWLYIELNAADLLTEAEAGVSNTTACYKAMLECMLEGDEFIVEAKRVSSKLTVRYYCDNLSESRRKYSEVNK